MFGAQTPSHTNLENLSARHGIPCLLLLHHSEAIGLQLACQPRQGLHDAVLCGGEGLRDGSSRGSRRGGGRGWSHVLWGCLLLLLLLRVVHGRGREGSGSRGGDTLLLLLLWVLETGVDAAVVVLIRGGRGGG